MEARGQRHTRCPTAKGGSADMPPSGLYPGTRPWQMETGRTGLGSLTPMAEKLCPPYHEDRRSRPSSSRAARAEGTLGYAQHSRTHGRLVTTRHDPEER